MRLLTRCNLWYVRGELGLDRLPTREENGNASENQFVACPRLSPAEDWSRFRGPNGPDIALTPAIRSLSGASSRPSSDSARRRTRAISSGSPLDKGLLLKSWALDVRPGRYSHLVTTLRSGTGYQAAMLAAIFATTSGLAEARLVFSCGSASRSKSCGRFSMDL